MGITVDRVASHPVMDAPAVHTVPAVAPASGLPLDPIADRDCATARPWWQSWWPLAICSRGSASSEDCEFVLGPNGPLEVEEPPEEEPPDTVAPGDVKLHPPGRLVHLYRHCGVRRAAWVPRTHPALHRIEVELGLLQDHSGEAYKSALDEAMASAMGAQPPPWKPFAEVARCGCCSEAFGWDSVLRSEPHRLQARHHCQSCGTVVCSSCSQRRRPLPQLGILEERRICDRCFLRPGGTLGASAIAVPPSPAANLQAEVRKAAQPAKGCTMGALGPWGAAWPFAGGS